MQPTTLFTGLCQLPSCTLHLVYADAMHLANADAGAVLFAKMQMPCILPL
jgi:hypothetical protein